MPSQKEIDRAIAEGERLAEKDIPSDKDIGEQYEKDMARAMEGLKLLKKIREPVSRRKSAPKKRSK